MGSGLASGSRFCGGQACAGAGWRNSLAGITLAPAIRARCASSWSFVTTAYWPGSRFSCQEGDDRIVGGLAGRENRT